ncbi:hydrogenase maturation protease [Actinomadura spongiicola]|uniref:Hydrogenase maturation protease n=1 Tax=Actinomadura spongiicola TaxID=2303421 RepID=A0A372GQM6_9ACTN|nr:hydrogenase maturation protease [Actinomadura spongiicola]RFS87442.1 hydrogenase maturation protease [Actinomadura spongiicola]
MSGADRRVLVAGIGNVFLGDDGFGVEVVRRMDGSVLPANVEVADYGVRGVHLAYEVLDGRHDVLIMVDAVPVEGPPGTLAVIEVDAATVDGTETGADPEDPLGPPAVDGHGMHPVAVLRLLRRLGGDLPRVFVVGCRPAVVDERMELSEPVRAAVDEAVRMVTELACDEAAHDKTASTDSERTHA